MNMKTQAGFLLSQRMTVPTRRAASKATVAAVTASIVVIAVLLVPRLGKIASGADGPAAAIVHQEVYDALATSPDGRVYVMMLLDGFFTLQDLQDVDRAARIYEQQQAVPDGFGKGEFELVHRAEAVAGLTGRINKTGVDRLATNSLVFEVAVDVMNDGCVGVSPGGCGADDLKATSLFILTEVLTRTGSAGATSDQSLSSPASGALLLGQGQGFCAAPEQRNGSGPVNLTVA